MKDVMLSAKSPLLVGSGRPFGTTDEAPTLAFPLPSTVAGALRGAWAHQEKWSFSVPAVIDKLRGTQVSGPLLGKRRDDDSVTLHVPRPADAVGFRFLGRGGAQVGRVTPVSGITGGMNGPSTLSPLGFTVDALNDGEPFEAVNLGAFWSMRTMARWLLDAPTQLPLDELDITGPLPIDTRTHVEIVPGRRTARDEHLFQTQGLDFGPAWDETTQRWSDEEAVLMAQIDASLEPALRTFGGRSRVVGVEPAPAGVWPTVCEPGLSGALGGKRWFKLHFLTPALFKHGWYPSWLSPQGEHLQGPWGGDGPRVRLVGAAGGAWQTVSRWDLNAKGRGTFHRAFPAGGVLWFKVLDEGLDIAARWFEHVSDDGAKDGFGLVVPGVWDGIKSLTANNDKKGLS